MWLGNIIGHKLKTILEKILLRNAEYSQRDFLLAEAGMKSYLQLPFYIFIKIDCKIMEKIGGGLLRPLLLVFKL